MIRQIGKFRVLKEIATGGMAEIYVAAQGMPGGDHKLVVIKMLRADLRSNREYVQLFLNEARIASRLMHPNVVQMYDLGYADGNYFIAMEYIHGENVYSIAKSCKKLKRRIPLALSVRIAHQACLGLQYAHTKTDVVGRPLNIVHCDISPQNIIVSFDGAVKVLDFGVARAASHFQRQESKKTVKGKLPYMSPEQVTGISLDARTDVYATGTVLWELVTGRRRYRKAKNADIFRDIIEGSVPPPNRWNPDIPGQLEAVILKALVKDPDARFQTADQFASALAKVAGQVGLESTPDDLASFMRDLFSDHIESAAKIDEALAQGAIESRILSDLDAHGFEPLVDEPPESEEPAETPELSMPTEPASPATRPPDRQARRPEPGARRSRLRPVLLLLLVVAAAVAAGLWLYKHRSQAPPRPADSVNDKCMISVSSRPAKAEVFVDGSKRCQTPCIVQNLDVGSEHELKIKKRGLRPFSTRFKLTKKFEVKKFSVKLRR